jgi:hypothetical protein
VIIKKSSIITPAVPGYVDSPTDSDYTLTGLPHGKTVSAFDESLPSDPAQIVVP